MWHVSHTRRSGPNASSLAVQSLRLLIVAKRGGRVGGRKTVMAPQRVEAPRKLLASGMSAREIAPTNGVSVATLYRHLPAPEQEAINAEARTG